jgi:UDP-N-acetylmuramyl pentapeptide phosphotransferase/UDP-N-acetylglucosamine-1-phosphate transferase
MLFVLFIFFFGGMTAFSLLINSILLRFVKTLGTKNQPGAVVRWSGQTKPAIGGLAFFIIFLITICIYSVAFDPYRFLKACLPWGCSWPELWALCSALQTMLITPGQC